LARADQYLGKVTVESEDLSPQEVVVELDDHHIAVEIQLGAVLMF
jgi:hypothetical protein